MKIITRAGLKRIAVMSVVLSIALVWFYQTMIKMPGKSFSGPLPALTPQQKALSESLKRDLNVLAGSIGSRSVYTPKKLAEAADFVEKGLARSGRPVRRQTFEVSRQTCANLEVEIPGKSLKEEIVVVGAHYDSVDDTPGANDNGSGVVALLALAERLGKSTPERTLRFVAFVNEEPPHFQNEQMGSWVYAKAAHAKGEKIVAMISLETMGYYSDERGSQKYPFLLLKAFYPSRGNFIALVSDNGSKKLLQECVAIFRKETSFPSEGATLPTRVPGIGWSDQWAFWQEGYPGLMVTDTAPFRYAHYHQPTDTPDKVDYERLARVTEGVEKVVQGLATPIKK
jgi:hypothetical protein